MVTVAWFLFGMVVGAIGTIMLEAHLNGIL